MPDFAATCGRTWTLALAAALSLTLPACGPGGPEMASVTGKVTQKGKPLEKGNISFVPVGEGQPPAASPIGADGTYSLHTADGRTGAQLGEYKVAITDLDPDAPNQDIPGMPVKVKSSLPKKYTDPDKSGFKATVVSGSNTFDFDAKD